MTPNGFDRMSSTNRGYEPHASDYYVTPPADIVKFLRAWKEDCGELMAGIRTILDPCAGGTVKDGEVVTPMSYAQAINHAPAFQPQAWFAEDWRYDSMDIRADSCAKVKADYLTTAVEAPDLIITNPPFSLALEITEKALRDVRLGGFVVMLQRINWLGSARRREFWQANMPSWIYLHSERINFCQGMKHRKTGRAMSGDSIEYAHFVWRKGFRPKFAELRVI